MAKPFLSHLLQGYTIAIITAHLPGNICGRVWAPGQTPSAPNQWKLHVQSYNAFRARLPLTKFKKNLKKIKEIAAI